ELDQSIRLARLEINALPKLRHTALPVVADDELPCASSSEADRRGIERFRLVLRKIGRCPVASIHEINSGRYGADHRAVRPAQRECPTRPGEINRHGIA